MEEQRKKDRLKIAIIVLAILLGISSVALAGTILYKHLVSSEPSSVVVPDNIITPDTEKEEQTDTEESIENKDVADSSEKQVQSSEDTGEETSETTQNQVSSVIASTNGNTKENRMATALSLHNRNAGDNVAFNTGNMFPGDAETKYFCVQVSFQDTVTVKYHADIRPGYEKLAEVMKCRIVLLTTGETLYDGLMRDMPASLDHSMYSTESTTNELYYEIIAYLDTSVGNEYQNKTLIADFRWWVEEVGHLVDAPKTGDDFNMGLWAGLSFASLFMLILLFMKRKKEEQDEQ